jgi:hypothetical protein
MGRTMCEAPAGFKSSSRICMNLAWGGSPFAHPVSVGRGTGNGLGAGHTRPFGRAACRSTADSSPLFSPVRLSGCATCRFSGSPLFGLAGLDRKERRDGRIWQFIEPMDKAFSYTHELVEPQSTRLRRLVAEIVDLEENPDTGIRVADYERFCGIETFPRCW